MDLSALRQARDAAQRTYNQARDAIEDASPNDDLDALRRSFEEASEELDRTEGNLRYAQSSQRAHDAQRPDLRSAGHVVSIREPLTYSEHDSKRSFFADAYAMQTTADPAARERLEKHGRENLDQMRARGVQLRDVGTGAFAGFTVPQYLVDLYAPFARAASPALNFFQKDKLPEHGMTLNLARITTASAVAAQNGENTAVQETDLDDTLLTINIRTYAGQQDVSRQALERSELIDQVVFQDLVADYYTKLDSACLNADGTAGTHLGIRSTSGINTIAYTDGTPTVPELWPKLADAIRQVNESIYTFAKATTILMHSRRWAWITAALDSSSRPLFIPDSSTAYNPIAVGDAATYGQVVGRLMGLPVITNDNLPTNLGAGTNEDCILVVSGWNPKIWGDSLDLQPRQFRFEQTAAPQSIRLAVWGYSAFTAGRYPGSTSVISGTGLVTPTF